MFIQVPLNTVGLSDGEYLKFRQTLLTRYTKFRYVGQSTTVKRTGDRSLLSTATANSVTTADWEESKVNSRCKSVVDSWVNLDEVTGNPVGMESAPNVKHLYLNKPCKLSKFKVPQNIKNVQWIPCNTTQLPTTIPTWLANKTSSALMPYFYPASYTGGSPPVSDNVPSIAQLRFDSYPRIPVPPALTGVTTTVKTQFSIAVYKNFYFVAQGRDVNAGQS